MGTGCRTWYLRALVSPVPCPFLVSELGHTGRGQGVSVIAAFFLSRFSFESRYLTPQCSLFCGYMTVITAINWRVIVKIK